MAERVVMAAGQLPPDPGLVALLGRSGTASGRTLLELLDAQPVLLIFLRHLGDSFARRTLFDVGRAKAALDRRGVRPVFVHMATAERAERLLRRYGLAGVEHVSDPGMQLYTAPEFHLLKSTILPHFFGARAYLALLKGPLWRHGAALAGKEDATQLPGVFFLRDRAVYRAFRHKYLDERPDYERFGM